MKRLNNTALTKLLEKSSFQYFIKNSTSKYSFIKPIQHYFKINMNINSFNHINKALFSNLAIKNFTETTSCNKSSQNSCGSSNISNNQELPELDFSKLSKNCYIEQIPTKCLSLFSYYIEADGRAIVIDPQRDIEYYIELSKKRNSKIIYIAESHFHADYVSGHYNLSQKTGAKIIYGPGAKSEFDIVNTADDMVFKLSDKISIRLIHTPGHTLESSCYSLEENINGKNKVICLFTGDTLFKGEVGRPDLAVKSNLTSKDLSLMLYDSLEKIKKLPDDVIIFPGHGSGSECGKSIQSGNYTTIEHEKKFNYAFKCKKDEFSENVLSNMPTPPKYFFHDAMLNKQKIKSKEDVMRSFKHFTAEEFIKFVNEKKNEVQILDCREIKNEIYKTGFIPGSISVDLNMNFAIWSATLIHPSKGIILVCNEDKLNEAVDRLMRVGYETIYGCLEGGIKEYSKKGKVCMVNVINIKDFTKHIGDKNRVILDVRTDAERNTKGFIKDSIKISLQTLSENLSLVPKDKKIDILCFSGMRASIAKTVLIANGFINEINIVEGGVQNLIDNNFKLDH